MTGAARNEFWDEWQLAMVRAADVFDNPAPYSENEDDDVLHCGTCIANIVWEHLEPTIMAYIDNKEQR